MVLTPVLALGQDVPDQAEEEAAVRKVGTEYVEAFNKHDAKAIANHWSPEAVYLNRITGDQVVGRAAIRKQFEALFEPETKLQLAVSVESIQFISPNVAAEQGWRHSWCQRRLPSKLPTQPSTCGRQVSGCLTE